jgi:hypothetical protein
VSMDASHFLVRRIEVDGGSLQPQFEPGSTAFTVELKDREYDDVETLRIQVTLLANPGSTALPAASARGGGTPNTIAAALTAPSTARRDSTCGCGDEEEAVVSERVVIRTGTLQSVVVRC